jgi:P2 family phage contractile tail tube protein
MGFQTYKLNNAHALMDGVKTFGRVSEVDLPEITAVMQDHAVLGLNGKVELPTGLDKMEAVIRFNSIYPEFTGKLANVFRSRSIQIRSSQDVFEGSTRTEERPFVLFLRGTPKAQPAGSFKQNEFEGHEVTLNVTYIKLVINRIEVYEIDILNNIYKVDGADLLSQYRANLGL